MGADSAQPMTRAPFSFAGTIEATRLSPAYRAGLVVVALAMLLLPLVYVGVIALAGAGVWWHVTRHAWWIQGGSAIQWRLLGYVAPALAGTMVTFFMIKPVFTRRLRQRQPLVLDPTAHPQLFAFIEQICRHVRAPMPRVVQVDCQVNASASFAPHWQSMIRRDLVLTIGLPLVHALSVRELGGVLAHEFGHFAQGSGLRLTVLVRGINAWFSRVVYERDSWDRRLDEWSEAGDSRLMLLILPSRAGVWLSRQVLRLLMMGGHVISCFMMRQMEYDADSYEVKIAGSEAFASTMRHLRDLHLAMIHSSEYMHSEFAARRLPADLPLFLVTWQRSRGAGAAVEGEPPARRSGLFDTHPSDSDRMAAAARAANRGILIGGHDSAARLFDEFDVLSRNATRHYYEDRGVLDEVSLVDAADSVQASLGREARQQALLAIFDFGVSRFRPLRVPESGDAEPRAEVQTWRFPDALERFDDRMMQRAKAFAAHELFHAGYRGIEASQFGLSEWTLEAAMASEREAIEKIGVLSNVIGPYEQTRLHRVARGLDRLGLAGDARYSASELRSLVQALNATAAALDAGADLWRIRYADVVLTQVGEATGGSAQTRERRDKLNAIAGNLCARMRQALAGVSAPALFDSRGTTLEEMSGLAALTDPAQALVAIETLYNRLLLEVCWLTVRGEALDAPAAEAAAV